MAAIGVVTTDSSDAMASINTTGKPSEKLGRQKTSAHSYQVRTSSCASAPNQETVTGPSQSAVRACRFARRGPSPITVTSTLQE
jgi:hypothetical protein